jgi:glutamate/tyrosine decarboxylase-like PLP-dependent enzyme
MPSEWTVSVSTFSLTKVSGAYGGSGILARSLRPKYQGRWNGAHLFILDAHKWLFTPFNCCALLCLDPGLAHEPPSRSYVPTPA